ncbi:MAG: hypothetical protein OEY79_02285 [Anaplasmataceae bacterium]|nr:hypothetical protein [Anaplasmataceae bacterium]
MIFGRISGYHTNSGIYRITTNFIAEVSYKASFIIYENNRLYFDCLKYHKKKIFLAKLLLLFDDPFSLINKDVLCDDLKLIDNNSLLDGYRVIDFNGNKIGLLVTVQNFGAGSFLEIYIENKGICLLPFDDANVISIDDDCLSIFLSDINFDVMHFDIKL